MELAALQQLGSAELEEGITDRTAWMSVENILRQYASLFSDSLNFRQCLKIGIRAPENQEFSAEGT